MVQEKLDRGLRTRLEVTGSYGRAQTVLGLSPLLILVLLWSCIAVGPQSSDGDGRQRTTPAQGARSGRPSTGRLQPKPPYITRQLRVPFQILKRGSLRVGVPGGTIVGDPVEASERLFLIYRTGSLPVNDLRDLRGRVKVVTPAGALAFCRLKTSPVTYYLWHEPTVEVVSRDRVDRDFCFGDKKECAWLKTLHSGHVGIVHSAAELQRLGVKAATVCVTSRGFEVRRTLLEGDPLDIKMRYRIVQTRELVTREGGYSVLSTSKRLAASTAGVTWLIPFLM